MTPLHIPTSLAPHDHRHCLPPLQFSGLWGTSRGWAQQILPYRPWSIGTICVWPRSPPGLSCCRLWLWLGGILTRGSRSFHMDSLGMNYLLNIRRWLPVETTTGLSTTFLLHPFSDIRLRMIYFWPSLEGSVTEGTVMLDKVVNLGNSTLLSSTTMSCSRQKRLEVVNIFPVVSSQFWSQGSNSPKSMRMSDVFKVLKIFLKHFL